MKTRNKYGFEQILSDLSIILFIKEFVVIFKNNYIVLFNFFLQ